jgi:hypothetical protein
MGSCLKLEKDPVRDHKTAICSPLALKVLERKIFERCSYVLGFWPKFDLDINNNKKNYGH